VITVFKKVRYSSRPVKAIKYSWAFEVCGMRRLMDIYSLAGSSGGACDVLRNCCDLLFGTPALFGNFHSMTVRENV